MMYESGLFRAALKSYLERRVLWTGRPQGINTRNRPRLNGTGGNPERDKERGDTRVPGATQG